jgi:hypothetical protein
VKRDSLLKHALVVFAITLVAYVALYQVDRWLRLRHGPWQVTFTTTAEGAPAIDITAERIGINAVRVLFPGESGPAGLAAQTLVFDSPLQTNLPFGRTLFLDTTYLPGAVTMDLFGHEIELLPRTLVVNRKEVPWQSGQAISLQPAEKMPPASTPKPKRRY